MYSREEGKGIKIVSLLGYPELTLDSRDGSSAVYFVVRTGTGCFFGLHPGFPLLMQGFE